MKISIINLVAFFAIVIAVEAYQEDISFWDEFYALQNEKRSNDLIVDERIEEILEEVGYTTRGHNHRRKNQIDKYTSCMAWSSEENYAIIKNGEHTPKSLLDRWMGSTKGHRETILSSQNAYVGCARGRSGNNYSYLCAFRGTDKKNLMYTCSNRRFGIWPKGTFEYQRCGPPKCYD